jgi:hypothetical protein
MNDIDGAGPNDNQPNEKGTATMKLTTTPGNASSNLPSKPPVVDVSTWQAAREELLVRAKLTPDQPHLRRAS